MSNGNQRALVAAAIELLARRPPSSLSGREIADHANVVYGHIAHQFVTKDSLLLASFKCATSNVLAITTNPDLRTVAATIMSATPPVDVSAFASVVSDRAWFTAHAQRDPEVAALLAELFPDEIGPQAMIVLAAMFGWHLVETLAPVHGWELDGEFKAKVIDQIIAMWDQADSD